MQVRMTSNDCGCNSNCIYFVLIELFVMAYDKVWYLKQIYNEPGTN